MHLRQGLRLACPNQGYIPSPQPCPTDHRLLAAILGVVVVAALVGAAEVALGSVAEEDHRLCRRMLLNQNTRVRKLVVYSYMGSQLWGKITEQC